MSSSSSRFFVVLTLLALHNHIVLAVSENTTDHFRFLATRSLLQTAPAPAPFGAVLPNSDPTCDPQWAYETGCFSNYACDKGHICTCKDGSKCSDGGYFGIFLCPCDEAPQIPGPPPIPQPPPPPPPNCVSPTKSRCPSAYSQTDATQKCNQTGGTLTLLTSTKYACTCCTGTATIYPPPPPFRPPPPPPPPPKPPKDPGAAIRRQVGITVGCSIGGAFFLMAVICTCVCVSQRKGRSAASAGGGGIDPEQPRTFVKAASMPSEAPKGGAKRWFEAGYNGSSFKTTPKGVFLHTSTSTLPNHARFEELFAAAFAGSSAGAGPSRFTEEEGDTRGTKRGAGVGKGEKAQSGGTYSYARMGADAKAKKKEPEERTVSEEPAPPASIDGLPEDEICIVCCNAPKECVFVPCGHHATCMACGQLVQERAGKGCPICRRPIERVLRVYEA